MGIRLRETWMSCCVLILLLVFTAANSDKRRLVVVMVGGLRWDYINLLNKETSNGFRFFMKDGVRAEYVVPVFPSDSYPSWTTLSTGLYPESHGIIGEIMFDKKQNKVLAPGERGATMWWALAEPIWTTAIHAGLQVCTIDWPGSDVPVRGVTPEISTSGYNLEISIHKTLMRLRNGVDLIMIYHNAIYDAGLTYGPGSKATIAGMAKLGQALDILLLGLSQIKLDESVDVILVSDHGMSSNCYLTDVNITNIIDPNYVLKILGRNTHIELFVKPKMEKAIYAKVKRISGFNTKNKHDIPKEFHYRNAKYAPDYLLYSKFQLKKKCLKQYGVEGFQPSMPDMRGVFMGYGQSFRNGGVVVRAMKLVDVYQLYCTILDIKPRPNNGSLENALCVLAGESVAVRKRCDVFPAFQNISPYDKIEIDVNTVALKDLDYEENKDRYETDVTRKPRSYSVTINIDHKLVLCFLLLNAIVKLSTY